MKLDLPRYADKRGIALAGLLDNATTFSVQQPTRHVSETLTLTQGSSELALRYTAELYLSGKLRSLRRRDYAEFAGDLGAFEHYQAPWLLGVVHETIAETIAPHLPLRFIDPGTEKGSPYRYWTREPLHDYSVTATLKVPSVPRDSLVDLVTNLWTGRHGVSLILEPEVPHAAPHE
jgi:hypothetical protein